jgi:hypothetical protein
VEVAREQDISGVDDDDDDDNSKKNNNKMIFPPKRPFIYNARPPNFLSFLLNL